MVSHHDIYLNLENTLSNLRLNIRKIGRLSMPFTRKVSRPGLRIMGHLECERCTILTIMVHSCWILLVITSRLFTMELLKR